MSTKALKIVVVGLLVLVAGLLFTIRRLTEQVRENTAEPTATLAQVPAAPSVVEPAPAPVAPEAKRPSPIQTRRPVTRPRAVQAAQLPVPNPAPVMEAKPAPATASTPAPEPAPEPKVELPQAPPPPRQVTIAAGTAVVIRTQNTLSTERNLKGDTFTATLDQPLVVDGLVIAEKGAQVEGQVVRSEKAGRVEGLSALAVELVRLHTADGQRISLATEMHEVQGKQTRGSDAKKVGIGAGLGAIIGAIAGGGKGAAIGAGAGGAAGGGAVLATRGEPAVIPSESRLTFHLKTPVEATERR